MRLSRSPLIAPTVRAGVMKASSSTDTVARVANNCGPTATDTTPPARSINAGKPATPADSTSR